jgi:hypothetical protein
LVKTFEAKGWKRQSGNISRVVDSLQEEGEDYEKNEKLKDNLFYIS